MHVWRGDTNCTHVAHSFTHSISFIHLQTWGCDDIVWRREKYLKATSRWGFQYHKDVTMINVHTNPVHYEKPRTVQWESGHQALQLGMLHSPDVERFKQEIQLRYIGAHVAKGSHCKQTNKWGTSANKQTNKMTNDRTNERRNRLVKGGWWVEMPRCTIGRFIRGKISRGLHNPRLM